MLHVQGYSGSGSTGSDDEDMDSEDEEIDMGEVGPFSDHLPVLPSMHSSSHKSCSIPPALNSWQHVDYTE